MQQILMNTCCRIILASVLTSTVAACGTRKPEAGFLLEDTGWPSACSEGYHHGVSAPFCTIHEGSLLIAGGANFPEVPAAEGGKKRFYSDIHVLKQDGWTLAGQLPFPLAYGGCVTCGGRTLLIGGSNEDGIADDVFHLMPLGDGIMAIPDTPLPYPVEQAGYAAEGSTIYVAGGLTPDGVNGMVLSGTMKEDSIEWEEIAEMPEDLVQPIAFASDGYLYIWGGFDPRSGTVSTNGWRLDTDSRTWEAAGKGPDEETFAGASSVVLADGRAAVTGGVDKDIFTWGLSATGEDKAEYMAMDPEEYRFNGRLRLYDPEKGTWEVAGESAELALAGAGLATDGSTLYIAGGEIKPGIRTPQTWKLELDIK